MGRDDGGTITGALASLALTLVSAMPLHTLLTLSPPTILDCNDREQTLGKITPIPVGDNVQPARFTDQESLGDERERTLRPRPCVAALLRL